MIKISILGDIMCEKEILNKKNPESTDFSNLFSQISPVLKIVITLSGIWNQFLPESQQLIPIQCIHLILLMYF